MWVKDGSDADINASTVCEPAQTRENMYIVFFLLLITELLHSV